MAVSPTYAFANGSSPHRTAVTTSLIAQQNGRTITGIIINLDGQFTLNNVPEGAVLVVSVESNINTVQPADVESMTVLKDAASASI